MTLFVDMDGVLANFDLHHEAVFGYRPDDIVRDVDWEAVRARGDFFLELPVMPDALELWEYVKRHNPVVLTGVPKRVPEAPANKRGWIKQYICDRVEVRCCLSSEKSLHCQPGDIIIDDRAKYQHRWEKKGGIWILHRSAAQSIAELMEMGL